MGSKILGRGRGRETWPPSGGRDGCWFFNPSGDGGGDGGWNWDWGGGTRNVKSALALPRCNAYPHLVSIFILLESCTKMPSNIVSIDEMLTSGQLANTTRVSYLAFFSFFKSWYLFLVDWCWLSSSCVFWVYMSNAFIHFVIRHSIIWQHILCSISRCTYMSFLSIISLNLSFMCTLKQDTLKRQN